MATFTNMAEKLAKNCNNDCAWIREVGGQRMQVYYSISKGDFRTALNTLKTQGGCGKCINFVEYEDMVRD